jgi:hypothetical protein
MRFVLLLPLLVGVAVADEASVGKCRAIVDTAQRLACYDSLAPASKPAVPEPLRLTVPEVPKVQLIESGPAARVERPSAALFGLEVQTQTAQSDRIDTSVEGRFDGWNAKTTIAFANGQVWQISDGSNAVLALVNPKVTIRRGFLGAFYLEIEGINRTARVRRVK